MDSLFPFLQGLAPLQHVGLSRRTEDNRPFGIFSDRPSGTKERGFFDSPRAPTPKATPEIHPKGQRTVYGRPPADLILIPLQAGRGSRRGR